MAKPRKGQFKSGGGRVGGSSHTSRPRKTTSTAIVVRQPAPVVVRASSHAPAKRHHGGGRRHRNGGGGNGDSLVSIAKEAGIAALMGYTIGDKAPHKLEFLDKIPDIGKLPKEAVIGGIAFVFRRKHRLIASLAKVGLIVAGNKIGANEFKLSGYYDD